MMYRLFVFTALLFCTLSLFSQPDSEWRGPNRSGKYEETNLIKKWPEAGPDLLWKQDGLGMTYSSVAIANNTIYTTGMVDTLDVITALDIDGKKRWSFPYGLAWENSYPNTRCTPTIADGKIYLFSGMGEAICLNAADGKQLWSVDVHKLYEGEAGRFGYSESLLLVDDKVICTPGGSKTAMVALNRETGALIWKTESMNESTAHVSPLYVNHNGRKLIVGATKETIIGTDADNGNVLWKYDFSQHRSKKGSGLCLYTNTPLYKNGELYITSGYNHNSAMIKLNADGSAVEELWVDSVLDCHHGGVLEIDGYIYGSNWQNNKSGNWVCLEWKSGKTMYEQEWNNKGPIIAADGMLYCYSEKPGEIALVKQNPEKFEIVSSFKLPSGNGPHWSHPVINNGRLYLRHGETLYVHKIAP